MTASVCPDCNFSPLVPHDPPSVLPRHDPDSADTTMVLVFLRAMSRSICLPCLLSRPLQTSTTPTSFVPILSAAAPHFVLTLSLAPQHARELTYQVGTILDDANVEIASQCRS